MTSIIKVDQIQNTAGTAGLTIDSDGFTSPKVPLFKVKLTSSQTVNHNSWTLVDWSAHGSVVYDNSSAWDSTNERWLPTQAGYYSISGGLTGGSGTLHAAGLKFRKNGSENIGESVFYGTSATALDDVAVSLTTIVYLDGTDYVEMQGFIYDEANATDLIFSSSTAPRTIFSGHYISA